MSNPRRPSGVNVKLDAIGWRLTISIGPAGFLVDTTRHIDLDDGDDTPAPNPNALTGQYL